MSILVQQHDPAEKRLWLHEVGIFTFIPNKGNGDCLFRCISQVLSNHNSNNSSSSNANNMTTATEEHHQEIRRLVVHHMTTNSKWSFYRKKIMNYWRSRLEGQEMMRLLFEQNHCSPMDPFILLNVCQLENDDDETIQKEFQGRMNSPKECGSLYELLGAGELYQFHVDYLTQVSKVKGLYTFLSCRTNDCAVPREKPHYVFYHKKYSCGQGHWQLLSPVVLLQTPFPLHRKIYGQRYSYLGNKFVQIDGFTLTKKLENCCYYLDQKLYDGKLDSIANSKLIKAQKLNLIPNDEDNKWPADKSDDFVGCCSPLISTSNHHGHERILDIIEDESKWALFLDRLRKLSVFHRRSRRKVGPI